MPTTIRSRRPTLLTQEEIEQNFADALNLLRAVRRTLADMLDDLAAGEDLSLKELTQKQADLESALRRAFEAEERYNAWHARNGGAVEPPASEIDFSALREEIACRLARLADRPGQLAAELPSQRLGAVAWQVVGQGGGDDRVELVGEVVGR